MIKIEEQLPLFPAEKHPYYSELSQKPQQGETESTPKERRTSEQSIDQIVEIFQKPLVVADLQWAEAIPDWLMQRVTLERLMQVYKREEGLATDAEAVCYLCTASLMSPLSNEYAKVYLYLAKQEFVREGKDVSQIEAPEALSNYEQHCLDELKQRIWTSAERRLKEKKKAIKERERMEAKHADKEAQANLNLESLKRKGGKENPEAMRDEN